MSLAALSITTASCVLPAVLSSQDLRVAGSREAAEALKAQGQAL